MEEIKPPMRAYVRHFVTDLEISESNRKRTESYEIIQKPDWGKIIYDFIDQKIDSHPEYNKLVQSIITDYKDNINKITKGYDERMQSAMFLKTFIQRLLFEKLTSELTDDTIIEYASLFISELELAQSDYLCICFLDGIFIEPNNIHINSGCIIRQIEKSDLEYTRDLFFDTNTYLKMNPSSILEIKLSAKNDQECLAYIERILDCLRLYKLDSVYTLLVKLSKKTVIWEKGQYIIGINRNYTNWYNYTINKSEQDTFIKFINRISDKLLKGDKTISISSRGYNFALMEFVDLDIRILMAIMGLEALFSKDPGENTFKLSLRVAKLLNNLGFESLKVKRCVTEMYIIRNKIIHGSNTRQKDKDKKIFTYIIKYLRISIVIFLLIGIGKKEMINLLDNSMIDEENNKILKDKLTQIRMELGDVLS
ncbi:MAG: hypothetical protein JW986_03195 [Methanotrichaceae archaeon]|nr:hypothetical protein [Methanotrichaceae archaeon]